MKRRRQSIQESMDNYKRSNYRRKKKKNKMFEVIMTENFPKLITDNKDSGSSETLTSVKPEENYTKRHPNQIYQSQ